MKAVSLFSGVGGFELGLERAGIHTVLQAEIDPWCLSVLERHWPEVERVHDVRAVSRVGEPASGDAPDGGGVLGDERRRQARRGLPGGADPGAIGVGGAVDADAAADSARAGGGVDLVYGGFPCQDVSVAGARAGFGGERSVLWFEFERVLRELRPRWALIENVPGLLSSGPEPGADFGVVLRGLVDLGYGVAWRTLDAKWFGVPQRRRRVFIVGCLGSAARAAQVLAVCESCGGHPAPRREAGQGTAHTLRGGTEGARGLNSPQAWNTDLVADATDTAFTLPSEHRGIGNAWNHNYLADNMGTLDASYGRLQGASNQHVDRDQLVVGSQLDEDQARPLVARGTGYRMDLESENFLMVTDTVRVEYGEQSFRGDGADNLVIDDVADPIGTNEGRIWTHEGSHNFRTHNVVEVWDDRNQATAEDEHHTLRGAGLQRSDVIAFSSKGGGGGALEDEEMSPTLAGTEGNGGVPPAVMGFYPTGGTHGVDASEDVSPAVKVGSGIDVPSAPAIAFDWQASAGNDQSWRGKGRQHVVRSGDHAGANSATRVDAVAGDFGVRRLTPLECERLMGFPDDWTRWTADGREIPDSHRYRMCGNGVVATVAEWLGHRLVEVDRWS